MNSNLTRGPEVRRKRRPATRPKTSLWTMPRHQSPRYKRHRNRVARRLLLASHDPPSLARPCSHPWKEQSRRLPPRVQQATCAPSEYFPPVAAPRAAKTYALPNPSAHHQHRARPVLFQVEMVERLDEPPLLFKEPRIVPTNSMTADHSLTT